MRFTPWETRKKYNDQLTRREADVEAGEERDQEMHGAGGFEQKLPRGGHRRI